MPSCIYCGTEFEKGVNELFCSNECLDETMDSIRDKTDREPKSLLSRDQVDKIAIDASKVLCDKFYKDLFSEFYDQVGQYLYEHHFNFKEKVFGEVFSFICGKDWNKYKDHYDASQLRALLYKENKEELDQMMTEQLVEEHIKKYFNLFLNDEQVTGWRYQDLEKKMVAWVLANFDGKFCQLKPLINLELQNENRTLKTIVENLKNRLEKIEEMAG